MPPTPTPNAIESTSDGTTVVFDSGTSNNGIGSNGHGNNNSNNGKRNKKKKNKKSKKKSSSSQQQQQQREESSTSAIFSDNVVNATHKRVHDDDEDDNNNNEENTNNATDNNECHNSKKQKTAVPSAAAHQSSSSSSSSVSWTLRRSTILAAYILFGIGTLFVTLPLVFTSCTLLGCGGRKNVKSMVDLVLLKKKQQSEDEENDLYFGDLMRYLQSLSTSSKPSTEIPIQESMCHVSFITIGQFVHYLPYAQLLVLRNPFGTVEGGGPTSSSDSGDNAAVKRRKKGLFQKIVSKQRKKHHHHEDDSSAASEEIDKHRPLRHILEGASIFFHHRQQKKMERKKKRKKKKATASQLEESDNRKEMEVDWSKWKYAMSDDYELNSGEISLIKELAGRVKSKDNTVCNSKEKNASGNDCNASDLQISSLSGGTNMPHRPFQERIDAVSWGGMKSSPFNRWWAAKEKISSKSNLPKKKLSAHSEGGRLLAAYLKIMKWPQDMHVKYPFRLCKDGCDSEVSLLHTLEWREKYKPWCTSPKGIQFNKAGFIYSRGHSKPGPKQRLETEEDSNMDAHSKAAYLAGAGHSMVWYRPGLASPSEDPELYGRQMINALEHAVSDSLVRNRGTIGRFNVVMDCTDMSSKNSPSIANVKKLFSVLQDHFPDRLGVLLAANLSGLTQMLMKMVLPFVTEDVRAKIHIIPNGVEERREMLLQFMDEEEIPFYLGGKDGYEFDAGGYYEGKCILSEEGVTEYRSTMPYHA